MQRSLIGRPPTRPLSVTCNYWIDLQVNTCKGSLPEFVLRPYDFLRLGWTLDSCQLAIYQDQYVG